MQQQSANAADSGLALAKKLGFGGDEKSFVTLRIGEQLFGIPVAQVRDVLRHQKITPVPLSLPEIAGSVNLRGRIVTVIDVRKRLRLPPPEQQRPPMNIVVEYGNELYSLLVDQVGDVLPVPAERFEKSPPNLAAHWQEIASGVYRLEKELLVVISIAGLLRL